MGRCPGDGLTYHTLGKGCSLEGGQAQVANLHRPCGSGDKDVVALEVPMDDGGRPGVQEQQALQDLPAPAAQDLGLHHLEPLQVPAGGGAAHRRLVWGRGFRLLGAVYLSPKQGHF